jgi:ribonuclease VapC
MARVVLDSSAVLAMLWNEPGADAVNNQLEGAMISAVNMAEVTTKMLDGRFTEDETRFALDQMKLDVIPFDSIQAFTCGQLRAPTRNKGLSLGDRACLALAMLKNTTILTTDRIWADINVGVKIEVIR